MLQIILRNAFLTSIVCLLFTVACDSRPSIVTTKAWQQSYRNAILDGYANFKGYYFEDDVGVAIFGYQLPQVKTKMIFEKLIKRLDSDKYKVISMSSQELVLRRPIAYSKHGGFDEYRYFVMEESGDVTVMFANLDSEVELGRHQEFIDEFNKISRIRSGRR